MIVKATVRRLAPLALLPLFATLPAPAQLLPQPSVPTTAAPLSFEEIFAGVNPAPLTLKTSDLKGEWRLVSIKTSPEAAGNAPSLNLGHHPNRSEQLREAMGAAPGQFITQGQTVAAGAELFLVAYRMKFDESDLDRTLETQVFAKQPGNAQFPPAEMTAFLENYARELPLELALINVKTLSELSGVRAFNADVQSTAIRTFIQAAIAEEAAHTPPTGPPYVNAPKAPAPSASKPPVSTPAATSKSAAAPKPSTPAATSATKNAASQSNLKRLGGALLAYAKANNGLLPPMGTPAQAKAALASLAGTTPIWTRADTGEAYRPNPMLSGRKVAHISNPDEFVAFYEAKPATDGTRGVLFLDGTTKRVTPDEWPRYKKASKLR